MTDITNIQDHLPLTELAEITLYINSRGKPSLGLTWVSEEFIETHYTVSERFSVLKRLIEESLGFFVECAEDFRDD